jgi:hypothetical protein
VGTWPTEKEAAIGRDRAALFYGRTAMLNLPTEALRLGPASVETLRAECHRARKATTSSRYRGVVWFVPGLCWRARITVNGELLSLGLFDDEVDAALAYDEAARKFHGERAKPNFSRDLRR